MTITYAFADLHGRFDLLVKAIGMIDADAAKYPDQEHSIVTLGDYVDRGPNSAQIIHFLMKVQDKGWPVVCLKGNHEAMMVETLQKPLQPDWWIGNGGGATLMSYGHPRQGEYNPKVVPKEHLDWLDALPLMHVDEKRVFVHAMVDPTLRLGEQKDQTLLWGLYPDGADIGHEERHVIHGHHQFADGPKLYENRTNLDTFAWYTGRLVIGVFDDTQPGPVRFIEVIGEQAPVAQR